MASFTLLLVCTTLNPPIKLLFTIICVTCNHLWESLFLWELFYLCKSLLIVKIFLNLFIFWKSFCISHIVKISFYLCSSVRISIAKYILETSVLKCIYWRSNFEVCLCSEMHFLREQLFQSSNLWLLISVVAALCFHDYWLVWLLLYVFHWSLHHKQNFFSFDMFKYKSRIIVDWLQSC